MIKHLAYAQVRYIPPLTLVIVPVAIRGNEQLIILLTPASPRRKIYLTSYV